MSKRLSRIAGPSHSGNLQEPVDLTSNTSSTTGSRDTHIEHIITKCALAPEHTHSRISNHRSSLCLHDTDHSYTARADICHTDTCCLDICCADTRPRDGDIFPQP